MKPDELLLSYFSAKACRNSFLEIIATNWSLHTEEGAVKEKMKKNDSCHHVVENCTVIRNQLLPHPLEFMSFQSCHVLDSE